MSDDSFPTDDIANEQQANDCLRYSLNELRALDAGEDLPRDRVTLPARLRALARHIELGGLPPNASAIIHEASATSIQS